MKKHFTGLANSIKIRWNKIFTPEETTEFNVTNLPDGLFLSPFTYDEFTARDYEGWVASFFLTTVVKKMLRENKGKFDALIEKDHITFTNIVIGIFLLSTILGFGSGVLFCVTKYGYPWYEARGGGQKWAIKIGGVAASVFFVEPLKVSFQYLRDHLVPKESKKVLRMNYVEANLDALVPVNGWLPPQFVEVLRAETPGYSSGDKSVQSNQELNEREQKAKDLDSNRRFPYHLEFLFHHNFRPPESYPDYSLLNGGQKTIQTESDNRNWAWTMVGIWALLPPTPESNANWGTSEEDSDRIAKYRIFAKGALTKNVFETMLTHEFDDSSLPPARLERVRERFASSESAPSIVLDSIKVDDFFKLMLNTADNSDVAVILEVMARDILSKS